MIKLGKPVKDISINKSTNIQNIFNEMAKSGGFESRNLADGLEILTSMIQDKKCSGFISFVGAIIAD